jgi:hypothetical protein
VTNRITQRIAAGLSLILGTAVIGAAIIERAPVQAIAGLALITVGLTAWVLTVIDRAIRDTSAERTRLQRLIDETVAQQQQYFAARAVLDGEAERLCRDMARVERDAANRIAAEKECLRIKAQAERDALLDEFENQRSTLKREAYLVGLGHGERGIVLGLTEPPVDAIILQLPVAAVGSTRTTAGQGAYLPS